MRPDHMTGLCCRRSWNGRVRLVILLAAAAFPGSTRALKVNRPVAGLAAL
jgi:hypothetical protein